MNAVVDALAKSAKPEHEQPKGIIAALSGFLNGGQDRRKWLDEKAGGLMGYIPPELRQWLDVADMMNPVSDIGRAGQSADKMMDPNLGGWDRAKAGGDMLVDMASVLAPAGAAKMAGAAPTKALMEGLMGWTPDAEDALGRFAGDEFGGIKAYHGSPHDFDKFSMDKIGTGEGAQAYGHGLYFAENEGVARSYRDNLGGVNLDGGPPTFMGGNIRPDGPPPNWAQVLEEDGDIQSALHRLNRMNDLDGMEALQNAVAQGRVSPKGSMYEVDIDANVEDFLDWDKPLSAQSQKVRDAMSRTARDVQPYGLDRISDDMRGNDMKRILQDPAGTAALREAGIPGIRYLDGVSRGAGEGSSNYVVFDDKLVNILSRNGTPTTPLTKAQQIADMLAGGRAGDVTDDLMAQADPSEMWKLYQSGATGADMPMDAASRMQRAEGMGFDESAFHGTGYGGFQAFSKNASRVGGATYSDLNPDVANGYAKYGSAGQVYPVRMRADNPDKSDLFSWDPLRETGAFDSAIARGHDAYYATDGRRIAFDPANIRSKFARFDPRLKHLANLSAAGAGAAYMGNQDDDMEQTRAWLESLK